MLANSTPTIFIGHAIATVAYPGVDQTASACMGPTKPLPAPTK